MTTQQVKSPTREELMRRASALVPRLRARAARTDEARQALPEAIDEILEAQLNRIAVPIKWGGFDVGYEVFLEVAAELSRGCGSTGWCYALWGAHAWLAGHFPLRGQEEIFADGPDVLMSNSGSSANVQCTPVEGGYRVSGMFEFGSGVDGAHWNTVGAPHPAGRMTLILPKSQYTIVDNWHVLGLRGTGSKNVLVEDQFVPDYRTRIGAVAGDQDWTGWEIHHQRRYRIPFRCLLLWDLVAPQLGITQAMIDEFIERMSSARAGLNKSAESVPVQLRLTSAAATLDACRALMRFDIRQMHEKAGRFEEFSQLERGKYERDRAWIVQRCMWAVNSLYDVCGAHALFDGDAFQRLHRDASSLPHRDGLVIDFSGQQWARAAMGVEG